jgi:hypothetical protein
MLSSEKFDRDSTLFVGRGLYVLRYEKGGAGRDAPIAYVSAAGGCENVLDVFSAPGTQQGRLDGPGDALIVRASDTASLRIGVRRKSPDGSLEAALRLESVGNLGASAPAPEARARVAETERATDGAMFVAHASRRGDVAVRSGQWVGGPDAPVKIEGLEFLETGLPEIEIEAQTIGPGPGASWTAWTRPGAFLGSRGRNLPLSGLRLRLTGEGARRYMICADALFLGSAIVTECGRSVELMSASARDPLVGLRLEVRPERRVSVWQTGRSDAVEVERRVRIFKAAAE